MATVKNLTNERFGKWTVLNRAPHRRGPNAVWTCRCDCGETRDVLQPNLTTGKTKSCGGCSSRYDNPRRYGPHHWKAKLTEDNVREIRARAGTVLQKVLAEQFNVHQSLISEIIHRKKWKHVA